MGALSPAQLAALRAEGQTLGDAFQVGKGGVTEGVVKELRAHLDRAPLVKVRILKSAGDAREVAARLAEDAGVVLVEVRGHTALFHKPKRGG
jgi:RNA-binding protein